MPPQRPLSLTNIPPQQHASTNQPTNNPGSQTACRHTANQAAGCSSRLGLSCCCPSAVLWCVSVGLVPHTVHPHHPVLTGENFLKVLQAHLQDQQQQQQRRQQNRNSEGQGQQQMLRCIIQCWMVNTSLTNFWLTNKTVLSSSSSSSSSLSYSKDLHTCHILRCLRFKAHRLLWFVGL